MDNSNKSENSFITWQKRKQSALMLLRDYLDEGHRTRLARVDERLLQYFDDISIHSSAIIDDPNDFHGYYEVLGAVKFLRMFDTYHFDENKVRFLLRLREGDWHKDGDRWVYDKGGLKQDGNDGATVYRWEPFQVFILASVFGFKEWVNTRNRAGSRALRDTEMECKGSIYDMRRVCTDFTFYGARKNDKTGLSAFVQLVFFLFEDSNAEVYCISNSADQAKVLYNRTREMILQIDHGRRIRNTATVCDWLPQYHNVRTSIIKPLTAGPKSKDGLKAQLASIDEYGSAAYTKGKSDMQKLVDVVKSSMGSRREPLSFTTTTAGRIDSGPFMEKLDGLHYMLEQELRYGSLDDKGNTIMPTLSGDRTMCLCLEPDRWERSEDYLLSHSNVRYKVCPMLGKVVQHSYYDDLIANVRNGLADPDELITKNFNIYKNESQAEWISPELIHSLQVDMRVTDCVGNGDPVNGWTIYTGMDFSLGDDLHALSYLCTRIDPDTGQRIFFADCDAWLTEHSLENHPMRNVFETWIKQGWLHVSPGATLQPELPIGRISEIAPQVDYNLMMFLYDPYKADMPINALKSYVVSLGIDPTNVVVPCRQNYATFNPLVMEFDFLVKNDPPFIHFSRSPLWTWEAGNMVLDTSADGMENKKPRKKSANAKIDNYICILEALKGFDILSGKVDVQK